MKYTEIDLQIEDVMWFAIDKNGIVFEATSGGCADVPKFVIDSREENEKLNAYFLNLSEGNAIPKFLEDLDPDYPAYDECMMLTKNGIACFDVDGDEPDSYKKIAATSRPKKIDDLPEDIRKSMISRTVDFDAAANLKLHVSHGS